MILPPSAGSPRRPPVSKKSLASTVSAERSSHSVFSFRLRPGSSIAATETYPESINLDDFDGLFQLSEYLEARVRRGDPARDLVVEPSSEPVEPGDDATSADGDMWLYVHLLRLPKDLTTLVTSLLETCRSDSCPQMRAGEWQYVCAAHPSAKNCAAPSYITHTLDQACQLLTSPKLFPSRLSIPQTSLNPLRQTARRLSRIFSHAYHHHREVFEHAEAETNLYERFVLLSDRYKLIPLADLAIPSERFLSFRTLPSPSSSRSSPPSIPKEPSYRINRFTSSPRAEEAERRTSTDKTGSANRGTREEEEDDDDDVFSRGPKLSEFGRSTTGGRGRAPRGKIIDFGVGKGTEVESDEDEEHGEQERKREEDVTISGRPRGLLDLEDHPSISTTLSAPASPLPPPSPFTPSRSSSKNKHRRIKPKSVKPPITK